MEPGHAVRGFARSVCTVGPWHKKHHTTLKSRAHSHGSSLRRDATAKLISGPWRDQLKELLHLLTLLDSLTLLAVWRQP